MIKNRAYVRQLLDCLKLEIQGIQIMVVHGSHRDIAEYVYEDETLLRQLSKTLEADVLICGHTHVPYEFKMNNKIFINVVSVGKPKTGDDLAPYTIVDI